MSTIVISRTMSLIWLPRRPFGIAGAVEKFVMMQDHVQHLRREAALGRERVVAAARMLAYFGHFLRCQRAAGLSRIATGTKALPTSCSRAARASRR